MSRTEIDQLSEEELIDLNHRIVSRLRFLREARSHMQMLSFRIGEKVRFQPSGLPEVLGTLTRYNKKSVTIVAENGERWNVHPSFLSRISPSGASSGAGSSSVPGIRDVNRQEGSIIPFRPPTTSS